jgi:hypothetical protein
MNREPAMKGRDVRLPWSKGPFITTHPSGEATAERDSAGTGRRAKPVRPGPAGSVPPPQRNPTEDRQAHQVRDSEIVDTSPQAMKDTVGRRGLGSAGLRFQA